MSNTSSLVAETAAETTAETSARVKAALHAIQAIADAIRELREVPSGKLYAAMVGVVSLREYEYTINMLVRGGLVRKRNDLLTWVA